MKELATSRLRLRRYDETDARFLFDMYRRPEVLRFLSKARLADLAAASDVVRERKQLDLGMTDRYYSGTPLRLFRTTSG